MQNKQSLLLRNQIPKNWQKVKLGKICKSIIGGGTPTRGNEDYWNGKIPWASVKDLKEGLYLSKTQESITTEGLKKSAANLIPRGNIVTSTRMGIGRFYLNMIDLAINQDLKGLILEKNVNPSYILFSLLAQKDKIEKIGTGTTVKGIKLDQLNNLDILLPPFRIQSKVAAILSSIDEAIQKTDQIIKKTEALKNGLMNELLIKGIGHKKFKKTKLGEIPENWELVPLGKIIEKLEAGVSVNSEDKLVEENEYGILKTSAVTYGYFNPREHKKIIDKDLTRARIKPKKDHIILSRMNTPLLVGANAYVDKDYVYLFLPDRLWQIELFDNSKVFTKWLSYQLSWLPTITRIREIASGTSASMKNISKQKILTLEIAVPPYQEQKKISELIDGVEKKITHENGNKSTLRSLKSGLMQDIFSQKVQI